MCMSTVLCESSCSSGQTAIGTWFFSQGINYVFCARLYSSCGVWTCFKVSPEATKINQMHPNADAFPAVIWYYNVLHVALRQVVRLNVRIKEDIEEARFAVITRNSFPLSAFFESFWQASLANISRSGLLALSNDISSNRQRLSGALHAVSSF